MLTIMKLKEVTTISVTTVYSYVEKKVSESKNQEKMNYP